MGSSELTSGIGSSMDARPYDSRGNKAIRTPDDGFRALVASILTTGLADAGKKDYGGMKARQADCFVRSRWCSELCDALDISVEAYRKAYRKKLRAEKRKKRKVFNDV